MIPSGTSLPDKANGVKKQTQSTSVCGFICEILNWSIQQELIRNNDCYCLLKCYSFISIIEIIHLKVLWIIQQKILYAQSPLLGTVPVGQTEAADPVV